MGVMVALVMVVMVMVPSQYDAKWVRRLSQRLVDGITSQLDHVVRNGDPKQTYHGEVPLYQLTSPLPPPSLPPFFPPHQDVSICPLPMWREKAC